MGERSDKKTGTTAWEMDLPARVSNAPMTYMSAASSTSSSRSPGGSITVSSSRARCLIDQTCASSPVVTLAHFASTPFALIAPARALPA
jgi:hypothetical protein